MLRQVAHYVTLDGGSATSLPGTAVGVPVPTLAIFGSFGLNPSGSITGADNEVCPKCPHNETCTSPVSFGYMYKFFTGNDPISTDVLPDPDGHIYLAEGRSCIPKI